MEQVQINSNQLLSRINYLRELMISAGITKGFHSSETLKYSQDLDKLIIQFQLQSRP
jgi:hypothetical protein